MFDFSVYRILWAKKECPRLAFPYCKRSRFLFSGRGRGKDLVSFVSVISVISIPLSWLENGNTDWTDLRRFARISGRALQRGGTRWADQCDQSDQRHQCTSVMCGAREHRLDGLRGFAQIPGRSSSGAGLVGQISEISQISVISVLLSCVAGWNTDWTDCTDFHRFREGHREEQHIMTKIKVNERNHPKASPKHLQLPASDYPPRA